MNLLNDFSDKVLQEELRRRKKSKLTKPKMLDALNIKILGELCQDYIDALEKDNYVDEDLEHYIFEAALEAFFGKNVWDYVRNILK